MDSHSLFLTANADTSYDIELAGQLAAIGIVKGKPFNPDADTKRVLTEAANSLHPY